MVLCLGRAGGNAYLFLYACDATAALLAQVLGATSPGYHAGMTHLRQPVKPLLTFQLNAYFTVKKLLILAPKYFAGLQLGSGFLIKIKKKKVRNIRT